jgi:hypothetical protein
MLTESERELLDDLDIDETWKHVEYLSTLDKTSGTEGEQEAHEYVRAQLRGYGVEYHTYELNSLISHPKEATLIITHPAHMEMDCITHAFSASTPPEGVETELVSVPVSPSSLFTGLGNMIEEYKKSNVKGKVTLMRGIASPAVVLAAEQAGALAQIHICGGEVLHEMIVTTIWGTPTLKSANRIPKITAISIKKSDGDKLLELISKGSVKIQLQATTDTRWRNIPITVAEIKGKQNPEKFMLVHGHMDSWYLGTTDNCTGNAAKLELARILGKHREELKRSIRIAWWSGHSTGRYSGSTWYADNLFHDLDRNCFLTENIDSPGVKGTEELGAGGLMGTMKFINKAARDALNRDDIEERAYFMRAGDQSFYGFGIPSVAVRGYIPEGSPHKGKWIGGSGGAWWWHSAYDTLDKGDKKNLLRDMRMEAITIYRSVNTTVLPFDFSQVADMYKETLEEIQVKATIELFDLSPILKKIREIKKKALELNSSIGKFKNDKNAEKLNNLLIKITRILTSTYYTESGPFDQDPAYGIPSLPTLQGLTQLKNLNPQSDSARFLMTGMIRKANKIYTSLDETYSLLDKAVKLAS